MAEKEYIEREALLKELCTVSAPTPTESWIVEKCMNKVNEHPTADVVEVVYGEWVDPEDDDGGTTWYCNKCGIPAKTNWGIPYGNYCPNCGAKMDGKVLPHKFVGKSQDGECGVEIMDGKGDEEC